MVELWLVRHGETDWNRAGRIQGWQDIPLNSTGVDQATRLAEALHSVTFHRIVSSDLLRARQTAEILAAGRALPIEYTSDLRERCFGLAEGRLRHEVERLPHTHLGGAESEEAMSRRLTRFLDGSRAWRDERVLCVTHGGALRRLIRLATGVAVDWIDNTSVTRLIHDGSSWRLGELNETPHLASRA